MALPLFKTMLPEFQLMQTVWSQQINPVIQAPINKGNILKDIVLTTGSNTIDHKLDRALQGWFIVRQRALASIYDTQDTNQRPGVTLVLVTSANVTVDIFVF